MPQTQTRVVGSGYTTLTFNGQPLAWLDNFTDSGQPALGGQGGFEAVQPIGAKVPVEIATGRYMDVGQITFQIRELWVGPAWTQLQGLATMPDGSPPTSIVDVFATQAASSTVFSCQMLIKPPGSTTWGGFVYHNVIITGIGNGENVAPTTLTFDRTIQAVYTQKVYLNTSGAALL
jgi:hypothetical protein